MEIIDHNLQSQNLDLQMKVQKQLEFYLDDVNILKDKYMQNLLKQNKHIELQIFLKFNKIKLLLKDEYNPIEVLQKAVQNSSELKLSKKKDKLKRMRKFLCNAELILNVDKHTIYIENLPGCITQQLLSVVFSAVGQIKHISLPSYQNSKQNKGFGFIVFQEEESVKKAIDKFNNSVPTEFFNLHLKKKQALVIYSKIQWLQFKQQFKEIKKEISLSFHQKPNLKENTQDSNHMIIEKKGDEYIKNCFVKIQQIPKNFDKIQLKVLIKQYCKPIYVDYKKDCDYAIIRFKDEIEAYEFIQNSQKRPIYIDQQIIQISSIQGQEEEEYSKIVQKLQSNFKSYVSDKKQKKVKII